MPKKLGFPLICHKSVVFAHYGQAIEKFIWGERDKHLESFFLNEADLKVGRVQAEVYPGIYMLIKH